MVKKKIFSASVIGLGYVGLPMLHLMAKKKIDYLGFEKDTNKLNSLKNNKSYISDINSKELNIIKKNRIFDLKNIAHITNSDFIIFCLPTPLDKKNSPDMSLIVKAFNMVEPYLRKNQTIILESTVYPGATRDIFEKKLSKKFVLGKNFFLCYSPERINPGQKNKKGHKYFFENTTKVISGINKVSLRKISEIYNHLFKKTFSAKSLEAAEMAKLVENSYRSVNIGLVNELKMICKKMDLDIYEIIDIASTKPFGFTPFLPGPGVGGHCIPIDPIFIDWIARKNKTNAKFISLARRINLETTKWISLNIFKLFPKAKSKKNQVKVLIVGMAYKPNVNDIRESPGIKIYKEMIKHNNLVDFYDTKVPLIYVLGKNKFSNKIQNYKYYDFVILCTDHDDLNKKKLLEESKLIFDTRGVFKDIKLKKIVHL